LSAASGAAASWSALDESGFVSGAGELPWTAFLTRLDCSAFLRASKTMLNMFSPRKVRANRIMMLKLRTHQLCQHQTTFTRAGKAIIRMRGMRVNRFRRAVVVEIAALWKKLPVQRLRSEMSALYEANCGRI
jgi:hypothetical protein